MTKAEIEARIEKLESQRFNIEMKDHWSRDDYAAIDSIRTELENLRRALDDGKYD